MRRQVPRCNGLFCGRRLRERFKCRPVRIAWLSQGGGLQVCFARGTVSRIQSDGLERYCKSRLPVTGVPPSAFFALSVFLPGFTGSATGHESDADQCLDAEIMPPVRRRCSGAGHAATGVKVRGIAGARLSGGDRNARSCSPGAVLGFERDGGMKWRQGSVHAPRPTV
jgi:hypothetical protein